TAGPAARTVGVGAVIGDGHVVGQQLTVVVDAAPVVVGPVARDGRVVERQSSVGREDAAARAIGTVGGVVGDRGVRDREPAAIVEDPAAAVGGTDARSGIAVDRRAAADDHEAVGARLVPQSAPLAGGGIAVDGAADSRHPRAVGA